MKKVVIFSQSSRPLLQIACLFEPTVQKLQIFNLHLLYNEQRTAANRHIWSWNQRICMWFYTIMIIETLLPAALHHFMTFKTRNLDSGDCKSQLQREHKWTASALSEGLVAHQLWTLSALVVGEDTETFVAVTFEEDHTSGRTSISAQTEIKLTLKKRKTENKSLEEVVLPTWWQWQCT